MNLKLDSSNFESYINANSVPVLVDFYSDTCNSCKKITPFLENAQGEYTERLDFASVNIADDSKLASKYSVEAVPTLIVFKDGEEISRMNGAVNNSKLKSFIDSALL